MTNDGSGWSVDAVGIIDSRTLPDSSFDDLWEAIVVESELKTRLFSQGILNFTLRPKLRSALVPLHGIILLVGPPGTGKTSLARGLASRIAGALDGLGTFRYMEVEPHALASAALGRSQKAVTELFGQTIAEHANEPLIVLLDEIETLAADRSKLSLEANPVDVHRATDAVLAQLDHLAAKHRQLLFIATSNFPAAIDGAFLSRADLVCTVDTPSPEACLTILQSAIAGLAEAHPRLADLRETKEVVRASELCSGMDGRQIRKLVISACGRNKEVAIDPSRLTAADILAAAQTVHDERARLSETMQ